MATQLTHTFTTGSGLQFAFTSGVTHGGFRLQVTPGDSGERVSSQDDRLNADLTVDELDELRSILTTLIKQARLGRAATE